MPKTLKHLSKLSLLGFILLAVAACGGDESNVGDATPELAVVVFATEDPTTAEPTATPLPTAVTQPPPTPTSGATAGMGIGDDISAQSGDTSGVSDFEASVANRPPDVNPLTGLKVDDPALLQRRPLMVRVGNDPGARPQVALNEADMVYEEIAEWWITRFTAIYLSQDPEMIAPIRSARLINLQLTSQYGGVLANSGGSDGVRWELSQSDLVNLDEFFVPRPYFYRPNEGWQTRLALDATAARDHLAGEGLERDVNLRGFYFSDTIDAAALPAGVVSDAREVIVPFPQRTSEATWQYDDSSGRYLRFTTGTPHFDFSGEQVSAANVIIYFADHQPTDIVEDSNGATSIRIIIDGRGAAWLLRDGKILKGNWETDGQQTPKFIFDNGHPMPLKPGNTWVQVVPLEYFISVDGADYSSLPELNPTVEAVDSNAAPAGEPSPTPTLEIAADEPQPTPTFTPIGARPQATPGSQ